jgi:anthranilate synthase component I
MPILHDANAYENAQQRLDELVTKLRELKAQSHSHDTVKHVAEEHFVSGFTQQGFEEAIVKAKQYITNGDIMQVVLSQRMSIPYAAAPLNLYRALRCLNPSPYMFYLNLAIFISSAHRRKFW